MRKSLVRLLVCPKCENKLNLQIDKRDAGEIKEGRLGCLKCKRKFRADHLLQELVEISASESEKLSLAEIKRAGNIEKNPLIKNIWLNEGDKKVKKIFQKQWKNAKNT